MMLRATGLSVRRAGRTLLDGVSMHAAPGEFVAVIGANGAGKSTLLATLAGLLAPDAGSVQLDDISIATLPPATLARRRAYLPQFLACEWPIPVEALVALGLLPVQPMSTRPAGPDAALERILAECGLLQHRHQPATTLSGGELTRAMLARALIADPDLLIVDEPMTGLDPPHVLDTARRLRARARRGHIVIAALHDLTVAARNATRVVALHRGRVVADGPVDSVLTAALIATLFGLRAAIVPTAAGRLIDYLD